MMSYPTSPLDTASVKENNTIEKPKSDFVRPVLANVSQQKAGGDDELRQGLGRVIGKVIDFKANSKKRKAISRYQSVNQPILALGQKFKKAV